MKKSPPLRWSALLPALLFLLAGQARAGSVTGRVLDANGKPIAGAKVQWTAYRSDDEALLEWTEAEKPPRFSAKRPPTRKGDSAWFSTSRGSQWRLRVLASGHPSARFAGPFDSAEEGSVFDVRSRPRSR